MATIRINMPGNKPKKETNFEMLKKASPLAASLTEKMLDEKFRRRRKDWCDRSHELLLLPDASVAELQAHLDKCPDVSSIEAAALKKRIDAKKLDCESDDTQSAPSNPPSISRPA